MDSRPELLSPAGSFACLLAAAGAGADAVYFGGELFNARRRAANFTTEEIEKAVALCHAHGVKINFTLNTLIKEKERQDLIRYLDEVLPLGIDAVIVQDFGVAREIARRYPKVELHASTQMAVTSAEGVKWLESLGFSRVVLARELSLEEISRIRECTHCELEVFIHGALCYSYSGRCLLSSFRGGRSGNRGMCAQPCRLSWKVEGTDETGRCPDKGRCEGAFMSLKDRWAVNHLEQLCQAGVSSLKIEGRMRSEAYVAGVTSFYRKMLDEYAKTGHIKVPDETWQRNIAQLYNRGGFTDGYFEHKDGMVFPGGVKNMGIPVGYVAEKNGQNVVLKALREKKAAEGLLFHAGDELEIRQGKKGPVEASVRLSTSMLRGQDYTEARMRLLEAVRRGDTVYRVVDPELNRTFEEKAAVIKDRKVHLTAVLREGQEILITGETEGRSGKVSASVTGSVVQKAQNQPLDEEKVREQFSRTGSSGYTVSTMDIQMEEGVFVPVSELNRLRRSLLEALSKKTMREIVPEAEREGKKILTEGTARRLSETDDFENKEKGHTYQLAIRTRAQWECLDKQKREAFETVLPDMAGFEKEDVLDFCLAVKRETPSAQVVPRLPLVCRPSHEAWIRQQIKKWREAGVNAFEVSLPGQVSLVREVGAKVWFGPAMGVMNLEAAAFLQNQGERFFASTELTTREIQRLGSLEGLCVQVYGYPDLMVSEQCLYKETFGCSRKEGGHLMTVADAQGRALKVESHCDLCYSQITYALPYSDPEEGSSMPYGAGLRVQLLYEEPGFDWTQKEKERGHFEKGVV